MRDIKPESNFISEISSLGRNSTSFLQAQLRFHSSYIILIVEMDHNTQDATRPSGAAQAVLKPSDPPPEGATEVKGIDFDHHADKNISVADMVEAMEHMGFQASSVGQAARVIDDMVCLVIRI